MKQLWLAIQYTWQWRGRHPATPLAPMSVPDIAFVSKWRYPNGSTESALKMAKKWACFSPPAYLFESTIQPSSMRTWVYQFQIPTCIWFTLIHNIKMWSLIGWTLSDGCRSALHGIFLPSLSLVYNLSRGRKCCQSGRVFCCGIQIRSFLEICVQQPKLLVDSPCAGWWFCCSSPSPTWSETCTPEFFRSCANSTPVSLYYTPVRRQMHDFAVYHASAAPFRCRTNVITKELGCKVSFLSCRDFPWTFCQHTVGGCRKRHNLGIDRVSRRLLLSCWRRTSCQVFLFKSRHCDSYVYSLSVFMLFYSRND